MIVFIFQKKFIYLNRGNRTIFLIRYNHHQYLKMMIIFKIIIFALKSFNNYQMLLIFRNTMLHYWTKMQIFPDFVHFLQSIEEMNFLMEIHFRQPFKKSADFFKNISLIKCNLQFPCDRKYID